MTIGVLISKFPAVDRTWAGQDLILGLAALDLNPQLLLEGAAVQLLAPNHDQYRGAEHERQSMQKRFRILELFDCPAVWVTQQDLDSYELNKNELILPVQIIDQQEWALQLQSLPSILRY